MIKKYVSIHEQSKGQILMLMTFWIKGYSFIGPNTQQHLLHCLFLTKNRNEDELNLELLVLLFWLQTVLMQLHHMK